jgi:phosphoribosyl 1,2-cyclic phosphate phosphodiesterase
MRDFARCPKNVCQEAARDPKHNRTRSSVLIDCDGDVLLIDVSQDFRQQALRERIGRIDAVLITHSHADHIGGIPDIRSYTRDRSLPFYCSAESAERIRRSFPYVFERPAQEGGGIPRVALRSIDEPFEALGRQITPLPVEHGSLAQCYGFRIGPLAYIPDLKAFKPGVLELLRGVDTLVIDALRDTRPHATHIILPESIELARRIGPRECYFTHLCHDIHYARDAHLLDDWMHFPWDGLTVTVHE